MTGKVLGVDVEDTLYNVSDPFFQAYNDFAAEFLEQEYFVKEVTYWDYGVIQKELADAKGWGPGDSADLFYSGEDEGGQHRKWPGFHTIVDHLWSDERPYWMEDVMEIRPLENLHEMKENLDFLKDEGPVEHVIVITSRKNHYPEENVRAKKNVEKIIEERLEKDGLYSPKSESVVDELVHEMDKTNYREGMIDLFYDDHPDLQQELDNAWRGQLQFLKIRSKEKDHGGDIAYGGRVENSGQLRDEVMEGFG